MCPTLIQVHVRQWQPTIKDLIRTSDFQFNQDREPTWKPAEAEVVSSINIVIHLFISVLFGEKIPAKFYSFSNSKLTPFGHYACPSNVDAVIAKFFSSNESHDWLKDNRGNFHYLKKKMQIQHLWYHNSQVFRVELGD